ncbi:MAG: aminotransferase class III-fold pyridoxal phosphate-dependent enzyme, partial [Ignavibacteria bacterium]|nr:aminotransferase class III-fold pyridoxal phosphate-dependent enzyme [Ignavibacteria bacterium]
LFLEFIQGEGGIHPADPSFVRSIETLRARFGFLLVADEIQSGLGRTGSMFAFEQYGVTPDLITVAKALGGGLPLGAILGNDRTRELLQPGSHGSTFGGNAAACAAGLVVLRALSQEGILENVAQMGELLKAKLGLLAEEFPGMIGEIRGRGLMVGVELKTDPQKVTLGLMNRHILVNVTGQSVLRILPPLIVGREHLDQFIEALKLVLIELSETVPEEGETRK